MIVSIGDDAAFGAAEVVQVEPEQAVGQKGEHFPQPVGIFRLTIRGQSHDLVFVAIVREAEQLGKGGVKNADAVGEVDRIEYGDLVTLPRADHGSGEVARTIYREQ